MRIFLKSNFLLIALAIICSCNKLPTNSVAKGEIEDDVYDNTFFDLKIEIPEAWIVEAIGEVEKTEESDREAGKRGILATKLLIIYKGNPDEEFKPNLIVTAEHRSLYPDCSSQDAKDYLEEQKKQYSNVQSATTDVESSVFANNKKCHSFDVSMKLPDIEISQTHYSTVQNNFYLDFVITYQTPSQKEELNTILSSLLFY